MADVKELNTRLRDAPMVSTLDISQAYNSICLTPEAAKLTSFFGPGRRARQYLELPYGYVGAAGILDSVLFQCLGDILNEPYKSVLQQHISQVDQVLSRLVKAGLKIKATKAMIAREITCCFDAAA